MSRARGPRRPRGGGRAARSRPGRLALVVIALSALAVGCAPDREPQAPASPASEDPEFLYVAIGGSDSVGVGSEEPLREAWPQVFYRRALPREATFVNLGVPGTTVEAAFVDEAQEAISLGPQLVTVWLNVKEVLLSVPVPAYEADLANLVRLLRHSGDTTVLVANVPPLDRLPAYLSCRAAPRSPSCPIPQALPGPEVIQANVDSYNAAIARVAHQEGAVLVDLHAAGLRARRQGGEERLVAEDGFHLSTSGHAAVADAFVAAWERRHQAPSSPGPEGLEVPSQAPGVAALRLAVRRPDDPARLG